MFQVQESSFYVFIVMTGTCVLLTETFFAAILVAQTERSRAEILFFNLVCGPNKNLEQEKTFKAEKFESVFKSERQKLTLMLILKVVYIL